MLVFDDDDGVEFVHRIMHTQRRFPICVIIEIRTESKLKTLGRLGHLRVDLHQSFVGTTRCQRLGTFDHPKQRP